MSTNADGSIREQVRARAEGRCEYCRIHDGDFAAATVFQVDHLVPQVTFRENDYRKDDIDNLAWCCPRCNRAKSSHTEGYDAQTQQLSALFNPRTDSWGTHFSALPSGHIIGTSIVGRATEARLDFNLPDRVKGRAGQRRLAKWP